MPTDYSADTSTQGVVVLNTPLQGAIEAGGDHDWFKLTVTENGVYTITLNAGGLVSGDSFLVLRNATGDVIATDDDDGSSYAPVLVDSSFSVDATKPAGGESLSSRLVITLKPGVYFIDVSTLLGSLGNTDPDDVGTYVLNVAHVSTPVVTTPAQPTTTGPGATTPVVNSPVTTTPVTTTPVTTTPVASTTPVVATPTNTTPVVTPDPAVTPVATPVVTVTTPVATLPVTANPAQTTGAASSTAPTSTATGTTSTSTTTSPVTTVTAPTAVALDTQFLKVSRLDAATTAQALADPANPLHTVVVAQQQIADQLNYGLISTAGAQSALFHLVDGTTSVAAITYAYFTGHTPSAAGLNYLVHSDANPTDLNDPYFAALTTENRYVNMAVALGAGQGEGAAAFAARFGALTLSQAAAVAYADVFGVAPAAGKIDAILGALVPDGHGGTETRAQYFADITGGGPLAQKAALIGFLLAEGVKGDIGPYAEANHNFLADLAEGSSPIYETDLVGTYGAAAIASGHAALDHGLAG